jgi:putative FmdB family regulatory protein
MPTYDYRCEACGHVEEIFHGMSEKPKKTCPKCKKPKLERLISGGAGFLFKGNGFYLTDYRSESYKAGQTADSATDSPAATSSPTPASTPAADSSSTPAKSAGKSPNKSPSKSQDKPQSKSSGKR